MWWFFVFCFGFCVGFFVHGLWGTIALEAISEATCCCRYAFIFYSLLSQATTEPKGSLKSQDPAPSSDIDSTI